MKIGAPLGNQLRSAFACFTSQRTMPGHSLLSTKSIAPRDRLIFALDVPAKAGALARIDRLGDAMTFYKLGLEFCMSGRYFEVLDELKARGKKVFAGLKFYDVPATCPRRARDVPATCPRRCAVRWRISPAAVLAAARCMA